MYIAFFRNLTERDRWKSNPITIGLTDVDFFYQADLPTDTIRLCKGNGTFEDWGFSETQVTVSGKNYNKLTFDSPFKCGLYSVMVKYGENYQFSEWFQALPLEFSADEDAFEWFHLPIMYSEIEKPLDKTKRHLPIFEKNFLPQFQSYHVGFEGYENVLRGSIYLVNEAGAEVKISDNVIDTVYKKKPNETYPREAVFSFLGQEGDYPVGWYRYKLYIAFRTDFAGEQITVLYYSDWFYLSDPSCDEQNNLLKITLQTNENLGKIASIYGSEFTFKIPAYLREIEVPKTEDGDSDVNQLLVPTLIYHKNRYIIQTGLVDSRTVDVLRTLPFWDSVIIESTTKTVFDLKDVEVLTEWQFESREYAIVTINMQADLIYKDILPPFSLVEFYVTDEDGVVAGAKITIDGEEITTNGAGYASIELMDGTYPYVIEKSGYQDYFGSVIVSGATVVNAELTGGLYTTAEITNLIENLGYIPVSTGAELNEIRATSNVTKTMGAGTIWEKPYTFKNDSNFVQVKRVSLVDYQSGTGWTPIPITNTNTAAAPAIYDGNELKITGLVINRNVQYQGLFGSVQSNLEMRNIRIIDAAVSSTQTRIGILIGRINNNFTYTQKYENIEVSGTINDCTQYAGMIGSIEGTSTSISIKNVRSNIDIVQNGGEFGGIVGYCNDVNTVIEKCYFNGNLQSDGNVNAGFCGGIAGRFIGEIKQCVFEGTISGNQLRGAGGIVGFAESSNAKVNECYSNGSVESNGSPGGIIGLANGGVFANNRSDSSVKLLRLFAATDPVHEFCGGLIGYMRGLDGSAALSNSFSTGTVTIDKTARPGDTITDGGLVGGIGSNTTTANSYWDINTSGQLFSASGTGQTTPALKADPIESGIYAAWSGTIWEKEAADYPTLKNIPT
jgi:hypothetical protein